MPPETFDAPSVRTSEAPKSALQDLAGKLFSDDNNSLWKKKDDTNSDNILDQKGRLSFSSLTSDDTSAARIIAPADSSHKIAKTTREMNESSTVMRDGMERTRALVKDDTVEGRQVTKVDATEARDQGFIVGGGLQSSTFSVINRDANTDTHIRPKSLEQGSSASSDVKFRDQYDIYNPFNSAASNTNDKFPFPSLDGTNPLDRGFMPFSDVQDGQSDFSPSYPGDWVSELRDLIDRLEHFQTDDGRFPFAPDNWRHGDEEHEHHRHHHRHHHNHHESPEPAPQPPPDVNPQPTPVPPEDVPPPTPTPNPPRDVPPQPPNDNPTPTPPHDTPTPPGDTHPPSADLKTAEQRFDSATSNLNANDAAKLKSYRDEMVQGCHDRGVSDTEVAKTLDQTSRLLENKSTVLDPSSEQQSRVVAAEGILKNAGHPDIYVNQGNHNTCNVTTVEERTYAKDPSRAAEIVTDSLLKGQYQSLDGKTVTLNKDALTPDANSRTNQLQGENSREYASQIFQAGVLTDLGLRNKPPVQYIANGGPGASGEGWITASGQKYSFDGTGVQEIADMNRYTNGDTNVVAAGFSSPQELESWISQNAGKQPLTIGVNGTDPLFYGDHTRSDGVTGGLNHVVSIEAYDAANHRVKVSNQWGANMDFWVDINLLYQAT